MQRSYSRVLRSLAAALLLGGFALGTAPVQAHHTASPITLTIWWWGEQEAKGAQGWMNETIRLYEKAHPNIRIKAVLQTTNGLYPAFDAAAAPRDHRVLRRGRVHYRENPSKPRPSVVEWIGSPVGDGLRRAARSHRGLLATLTIVA